MDKISIRFKGLYQYRDLLKQLVVRDVKLKYRRSFLGYLWSILNPLMMMMVLVVVFSNLFRFDIPNFPVYLITGSTLFGFMCEATSMAITSITGNAALLKKTYVPKYVFTLSRVTSSLVNMLFSMTAIIIVILVTNVRITTCILFTPLVILQVYFFSMGLGLFLASTSVFFRDLQYLWGIFTTMWMYLTPIFYPVKIIPEQYRFWYYWLNPMTGYISQFRDTVLYGQMPDLYTICMGFLTALIAIVIGTYTFYRSQDNFILYI